MNGSSFLDILWSLAERHTGKLATLGLFKRSLTEAKKHWFFCRSKEVGLPQSFFPQFCAGFTRERFESQAHSKEAGRERLAEDGESMEDR